MEQKSISEKKLKKLIDDVPDVNNPEEVCISYWQKIGNKLLYLEGWVDACLAGAGFPTIEEGSWDEKIDYIKKLTPEILERKAKERELKLIEGGFVEKTEEDFTEHLYGVTWGLYEKQESIPKWVNPNKKKE